MPYIIAVEVALPRHYYPQEHIATAVLRARSTGRAASNSTPSYVTVGNAARAVDVRHQVDASADEERLRRLFSAVGVEGRHLVLPLEAYPQLRGLEQRSRIWTEAALELGEQAVEGVLDKAGIEPKDIGLFVSNTVTGLAVPSLEARLMNRMGFQAACKRIPIFGLGCVAGAAGIARAHDYLRAFPTEAALLLCVELCSLTFQHDDLSMANIIASGLFGDGAACVLLVGDQHPLAGGGPSIQRTESVLFPDSEDTMGWDITDTGFRIVLDKGVPELARTALSRSVREFLGQSDISIEDIDAWIAHPGGPAVMDAMEQGLKLPADALDVSRQCLAKVGNLSSASVLVILRDVLEGNRLPQRGTGVLLAMGPGFCAELVLLTW